MSLDYEFGKCEAKGTPEFRDALEPMIWACLSLGLSGVTEKNLPEWVFRVEYRRQVHREFAHRWQTIGCDHCGGSGRIAVDEGGADTGLVCAVCNGTGKVTRHLSWYPDPATLRLFIGLRTNVSNQTRAAWLKNMQAGFVRDAERATRYALEEAAKAKEAATG